MNPLKAYFEERKEIRKMARRLAAIRLMEPQLDENYQKIKGKIFGLPEAN